MRTWLRDMFNNYHNTRTDDIPDFDDELTAIQTIMEAISEYQEELDDMIEWVRIKHPNITKERFARLMILK